MNMRLYLLTIFIFINSCSKRATNEEASNKMDSVTEVHSSVNALLGNSCFRQVMNHDTIILQLMIQGSGVTGELAVKPFEKDKAQGTISGTLINNQIHADWQRSGEGIIELHEVVFMLSGDTVTWREGERVQKQGKWILKNPAHGHEYVLTKIKCE